MKTSFAHDSRKLSETYDQVSHLQFEGGKRLVERLGLKEGARVLDVGCGTGRLAQWIAERVGTKGAVAGIDPLECCPFGASDSIDHRTFWYPSMIGGVAGFSYVPRIIQNQSNAKEGGQLVILMSWIHRPNPIADPLALNFFLGLRERIQLTTERG